MSLADLIEIDHNGSRRNWASSSSQRMAAGWREKGKAGDAQMNNRFRHVMDKLRDGGWKAAAKLSVPTTKPTIERMLATGWIERRGGGLKAEIRITPEGLIALKAPLPISRS